MSYHHKLLYHYVDDEFQFYVKYLFSENESRKFFISSTTCWMHKENQYYDAKTDYYDDEREFHDEIRLWN